MNSFYNMTILEEYMTRHKTNKNKMKNAKIFLVRHADYAGGGKDPIISSNGERQALELANKIKANLIEGDVTIWSSSAARAQGTAQIIKQELPLVEMVVKAQLWSDNEHRHDFKWLKEELESFQGDNLIIVSHLEYVRQYPGWIGFKENNAGYAQGVIIYNGNIESI